MIKKYSNLFRVADPGGVVPDPYPTLKKTLDPTKFIYRGKKYFSLFL